MGCLFATLTGTSSWHGIENMPPALPHQTARRRLLKNPLSCQACGKYQVTCVTGAAYLPSELKVHPNKG